MSIKHKIKALARKFGIQINRYNAAESQEARLFKLLSTHRIDVVLDVGANNGGYGRFLRKGGYQGDILSFEPLKEAHRALILAAAGDARWQVAPRVALGAEDGEIQINVAGNSTSSSVLPMRALHAEAAPQSRYVGVEQVPLMRLDSIRHPFLGQGRTIMLKIDTQGYEMSVLRGAEALLPYLRGVQLELSLAPLYEGQPLYREVIDWLSDRGFQLWNVIPGFVDRRSGRMLQMDGVFFTQSPPLTNGNAI